MDSLVIKGGQRLSGEIKISGAKNACLPCMIASLLTDQEVKITNAPLALVDVNTMQELLENHGAKISSSSSALSIQASDITNQTAPYEIVSRMRASFWVLAPLLARTGFAKVSMPGGCAIGGRQVDMHLDVLEKMGAEITLEHGYVIARAKRLKGVHYNFSKVSVGATHNAIMAATLADGQSILTNCAREPEIVSLCHMLQKMGAEIEGISTSKITITGKAELGGTTHRVIADRIEAGSYMIAAAVTKGDLTLRDINPELLIDPIEKLINMGIEVDAAQDGIRVRYSAPLQAINIDTAPYPGFSTDFQAQFMTLLALCRGSVSVVTENLFENRFMHAIELARLGADIKVKGHSAVIKGVSGFSGCEVTASDLRASASLVLAGLAAEGTTIVRRVYHLDRGYEHMERKLSACGADISRISS